MPGIRFEKGHGTGNDFVLIPDYSGELELSPTRVARICDRRRGVGADGLIRVVRSGAAPELGSAAVGHPAATAEWFMDYRNADGSFASMCGNGARVFARYLLSAGLAAGPQFAIMTRGGQRLVRVDVGGRIAVEIGHPVTGPAGSQPVVAVPGREWEASAWWLPNPHAVAWVDDLAEVGSLQTAPTVRSDRFDNGVNVEFAVDLSDEGGSAGAPSATMRVYERGVGETASCGTGACAVALSLRDRRAIVGPGTVTVRVPSGKLDVSFDDDDRIWLAGPAVLVAAGKLLDPLWDGLAS